VSELLSKDQLLF